MARVNFLFRHWKWFRRAARLYRATLTRHVRVTAVTGSLGKTTTTRAVTAALGLPEHPSIGVNEFTFVAWAMFRMKPWIRRGAVEVGVGAPGQMLGYANMIHPNTAVMTGIASEHHKSFGTREATRDEKFLLLKALPKNGVAVLNGDDEHALWMRDQLSVRSVTFGFEDHNDVKVTNVRLNWPQGTAFTLHLNGTEREMQTQLIGRTSVYAILAATAVGIESGIPLDTVIDRLEQLSPTEERLQPVRLPSGAMLLRDEMKSTLETIDAALDVLDEIPAKRKLVILGSISEPPGSQGPLYKRIGERVGSIADRAVFLGSKQQNYAGGALQAGMPDDAVVKAGKDLNQAIQALPSDLGEGDVILLKGRDNERLARIALRLMGHTVRCDIPLCTMFYATRCDRCPMLETGWDGEAVDQEFMSKR